MERNDDRAALTLEVNGDGVAWLIFDRPDSRVNLLTMGAMMRLDELLGQIEQGVAAGRIRGVVIRSGKAATFIAGANIEEIAAITDPAEATAKAAAAQRIFLRLDRVRVPTVAAIDGTCLGGGTELSLACDHRLASSRDETRIGLPEVRLGIIPGFGGTTRLPRVAGLQSALELILTGKAVNAKRAERLGVIDEAVPVNVLYSRAREIALGGARPARRKRPLAMRALEATPPGRQLILSQARKRVMGETKGHYPAPLAALDVIARTAGMNLERALDVEAEAVGRLIVSEVSKNLIHVFQLMEGAKKAGPEAEARVVDRIAVLGAGVMGGGIAQLAAQRSIAVRMKDIDAGAISSGLRHAKELFDRLVKRRRLERNLAEQKFGLISPTLDYTGFGSVDVVIEAVVERMDVKKQVLRETETHTRPGTVLASNTSALSISEMQRALTRPADFCGMHFFNPVHRMPLVEIIRGEQTSEEALATVFALTKRLDKTPLIVKDGPGFLVNRLLSPYLNEAGWLLEDGASIEAIDGALLRFGMPMGPLRLLDEVGLDVAGHAGTTMHEAFGARLAPAPAMAKLRTSGRLGRKGGLGFYSYKGKEEEPDAEVYTLLGQGPERGEVPENEIVDRTVLAIVNEAARVLEDGIVSNPGDIDLGMITGTGFPPFRGGVLRYADDRGLPQIVARLEALKSAFGERFEPAPLLRRYAAEGRGFYARS